MSSPKSASVCCYRRSIGQRLQSVWGPPLWRNLSLIAAGKTRHVLLMLGGSYLGYTRSTRHWWTPVERLLAEMISTRPSGLFRLLEHAQSCQRPVRHGQAPRA